MSYLEKSVTDPELERWASFMPALLTLLAVTKGPVLEVGVGHYSTPVLNAICRSACRPLLSLEDNKEWAMPLAKQFCDGPEGPHRFAVGGYDEMIAEAAKEKWSIALLDHSPGERRAADMVALADCVDYFVIHDYHLATAARFGAGLLECFNTVVTRSEPPTLVASKLTIPYGILAL